jgi:TolB-like protein/DNA-binding SARP family transcriptional activator
MEYCEGYSVEIPLKLNLLGRFEARLPSDEIVSLPTRKTETLLTYLALVPGPHSRDHLANLLWSDRSEQQARNSLRQALNAIKKLFTDIEPQPLQIEHMHVNLEHQSIEIDAARLEELIVKQTPQAVAQATKLYRGEFLEGVVVRDSNGEEWLAAERDRFRRLAIQGYENLLIYQFEADELIAAVETGEKLVSLDPLNESAWQQLMRVYTARGERNRALLAYKRCLDILEKELGVEPTQETIALQAEIKGESPTIEARLTPTGIEKLTDVVSGPAVAAGLPVPESFEKPSIVVLPLVCLGAESDDEYFAEGLTDDIIANLSRYRELFVIQADTALAYRDDSNDSSLFARQLGVDYLAKGNIRRSGEQIRISAQLINVTTGKTLWAERMDRDFKDLFVLEDEVAAKIASRLVSHIEDESSALAARKHPDDMNAFDCVIRARRNALSHDSDENERGRQLLEKAIQLDPGYARAYAYLAESLCNETETEWCKSRQEAIERAVSHARKAVTLDEFDAYAQAMMGEAYLYQKKFDLAEVHLNRAIECNPNSYDAYCTKSWLLALTGRASEVTVCGATALHLNPLAPDNCLLGMITANYTEGQYEDALDLLLRIQEVNEFSESWRAACLAQLGRDDEAQLAAANAIEMGGDFIQHGSWLEIWAFKNPDDLAHLVDGLNKSGVLQDMQRPSKNPPHVKK